jgi:hypothetical protein
VFLDYADKLGGVAVLLDELEDFQTVNFNGQYRGVDSVDVQE